MKTNQARRPPSLMSKIVTLIQKIVPNSKQRITASTSDDESSFLPEDMVLNILIKLPVKTLLRFECLSKGIKTLVESPYFVAAHAEHQGTNRTGIFLLARQINGNNRYNYNAKNNTSSVSCFSCPFLENPRLLRGLKYVGSWNGLVCLNVFVNRSSESNMVLWNPATSDFCFAPPPLIVPSDSGNDSVYGFGYDSVTDDYKSIRFIKPVSGPTKTVEVLSWRKRSWTKLEPERCLDEPFMGFDHVTSKGRANWMVKSSGNPSVMTPSFGSKIITFIKKIVSNRKQRKRRGSTRNDESSFLPEDVVVDILVKLPVKTLSRFKCLSTGIRNVIESPYFVAAHAELQRTNRTGIFVLTFSDKGTSTNHDSSVSCFSFPFLKSPNYPWLRYLGSWNGLVCLRVISVHTDMVLWNPATSKFSFAPHPPPPGRSFTKVVYGFGYDSVSDDYKSVRILKPMDGQTAVAILSWRQRIWTELTDETQIGLLDDIGIYDRFELVTSKGRVSWMVDGSSGGLLSFKLGQEKFEWISPPPEDRNRHKTACVWKGSLAMLVEKGSDCLSLWLFDDDDDRGYSFRWSKLFTFQTDYPSKSMNAGENILWTICGYGWNSVLMYPYDDRLAAWKLGRPSDNAIERCFEFAETLVPVPGSETS
ncbi:F-box protein CPR1 [Linum grandiflorum]